MKWNTILIERYINGLKQNYSDYFTKKYNCTNEQSYYNLKSEFAEGYCYYFAKFLKEVIKDGKIYCSENGQHCVYVFNNEYQIDITGIYPWQKELYKNDVTDEKGENYFFDIDITGTVTKEKTKDFNKNYLKIFLDYTKEFIKNNLSIIHKHN